ncbi:DMT family transporter [Roseibium sp. RKSG952]|nr:DMT family transporter [Roseibium sp. RKSG952]
MSRWNWILLFLLGGIWGASFLFAKIAVTQIPPLMLVFLRVALACGALHVILRFSGHKFPVTPSMLISFLVMGLLNNAVPFSLLFWGQTAIGAGLAAILNATTPLFTFLVAALLLRQEPVRPHRAVGVLFGFAGIVLMLSASLSGLDAAPFRAQLACLGAACSYAFAAAYAKRFSGLPPLVSATGQLTGSTLSMFPAALLTTGSWSSADVSYDVWGYVAALGLVATGLAYLIYFRLLADAGATNASLVTFLVPASAILLGHVVLEEGLTQIQMGGLGLLLAGLLVLDGRLLALVRRPEQFR